MALLRLLMRNNGRRHNGRRPGPGKDGAPPFIVCLASKGCLLRASLYRARLLRSQTIRTAASGLSQALSRQGVGEMV